MNIVLLTDIPPCHNYTAGIVLNILCDFLLDAGHHVFCFTVMDPSLTPNISPDKMERMKFETVNKPKEDWGRKAFRKYASLIGNNATTLFQLPSIMRKASAFCRENNADLLWSVVQGQTMIKLTEPTAKDARIPYVIQVFDPPEWWMYENRFDRYTRASVMRAFARSLHNSKCCLAASWAMAEEYASQYNCKAIPVILGFSPENVSPAGNHDSEKFVIALSGQVYASEEFNALIMGLNQLSWQHKGKQIILRLYGSHFNMSFSDASRIEVRGWLLQDQLLPELADADLLYCPYWFSEKYQAPARLSFPSKLSTYLKTAQPVLIHAPEYASPRRFIKKNEAGYICDTLDPAGIANTIKMIMDLSEEERKATGEKGYRVFLSTLTTAHMKDAFFAALEIGENVTD